MGFKRLEAEDFLVSADAVTSTVWTGNSPTLSTFHYSTAQSGDRSGDYYLSIYQASLAFNSDVNTTFSPSRTIYGQYRTLLLEDENASFNFGGVEQDYFYVISINRVSLTDNSKDVTLPTYYGAQRAYQIVAGSNGSATTGNGYAGVYFSPILLLYY